jgi:nicotinamidase-related amidase
MRNTILLLILISGLGVMHAQDNSGIQETKSAPKTALVLIDIQDFYFDTTRAPLVGRFEASEKSARVLEHFRETEQEIVHIMHKGGGEIHESVKPLPGETVFVKEYVSCFRETPLLEYLQENEVKRLVIVGMMTHMCVEAATRSADDLGFETILVGDACATRDLKYGEEIVSARDVHLSTLSTLRAYAKVTSTAEFLGE